MKKEKNYLGTLLLALLVIFFYMPIVFMIIFSFNSSKSLTHFTGFSLKWYGAMIKNHSMMESLYITIIIAILATAISTVIGTLTAIGLSQNGRKIRRFINVMNDFPLMNPDIVTAIGLMLLFITLNIPKGFITLLLAHIAFCIPYVMLSVMPRVRSLDHNLADAAMDLGASPTRAILQIIVPEIMPGIISGALIAFTMSFDDFIISYFVTGQGIKNLSIMVYTMSRRVNPSVNAISSIVVLLITIVLLIVNILPILNKKRKENSNNQELRKVGKAPKLIGGLIAVSLVIGAIYGITNTNSKPYANQTLHIYLPGEYISDDVIAKFEDETGAKVVTDNFDSNEQMYIKVANGEVYDILIPSDYMIQRLIQENYLQKIDQKVLKKSFNAINKDILNLSFDKNNQYSLPYFWGSVGISYDKRKVSKEELDKEGFNIFLNQKYKGDIYLYDSERDSFMQALKALNYSMNTENENELNEAYTYLEKIVKTMEPEIVTDEIIDNMTNSRKALGLVYSGDGATICSENKNMGFYMPKEGTNKWTDSMCILKNAKNVKLAYEFMNFITEYENAKENSEFVGYTSPNKKVETDLSKTTFKGNEAYSPRSNYANDEVFLFNDKTRKVISELWSKVKVVASNS